MTSMQTDGLNACKSILVVNPGDGLTPSDVRESLQFSKILETVIA